MDMKALKGYSLSNVELRDSYLKNAFEKETAYLVSLDTDRLLAGFRDTAGIDMRGKERYGGWENMLIGGHTLGHYAAACVQAYETVNATRELRDRFLEILVNIASGLRECQTATGTGFIFGAAILNRDNIEQQFDNIEHNKTNIITEAWVPWYTMHKIFEGLVAMGGMTAVSDSDAARVDAIKKTAVLVASDLADWTYRRIQTWSAELHNTVLSIEYGGMNDCLYDVYLLTGKEEHRLAAQAFDEDALFKRVLAAKPGDNVLNNRHANTTIPKFVGAAKRYAVTGEKDYLDYAAHFWELVVNEHSYITGGNSEWEHFGVDEILDAERTNANCETCNVYNMLKLTKLLFMATGEVKYADWYENTFINSILSSQNPETGMTTYFQPMATGYFKVYGEENTKFWCCTGTGMENFSKLGESFYFRKDDAVMVNQYFSSRLTADNIDMTQESGIPADDTAVFTLNRDFNGTLMFRLPDWLADKAVITVNGAVCNYEITGSTATAENESPVAQNGYAVLKGHFAAGTRIIVKLPMKLTAYSLPDGANTYAFKYGPVVLSALLGTEDMQKSKTGVDVTIPAAKLLGKEYLADGEIVTVTEKEVSVPEFMADINKYLVRMNDCKELCFKLSGTDAALIFTVHYRQYKERYGIYFKYADSVNTDSTINAARRLENEKFEASKLDTVQAGYGQYENDELHIMTEFGTGSTGTTDNGTSRAANAGGGFKYRMIADPAGTTLVFTLKDEDITKTIKISAGGTVLAEGMLLALGIEGRVPVSADKDYAGSDVRFTIPLPTDVLNNLETVRTDNGDAMAVEITFESADASASAAVCEFIYTLGHEYTEK